MKRTPSLRLGFTLIELLTVMSVIVVLSALTIAGVQHAQKSAKKDMISAQITALSSGLENYKIDNGDYPRSLPNAGGDSPTDTLNPLTDIDPSQANYRNASLVLYVALSGDLDRNGIGRDIDPNGDQTATPKPRLKSYFQFRPSMLSPKPPTEGGAVNSITALVDPFGNPFGYSTAYRADAMAHPATAAEPNPKRPGHNPTFDLWSTGDPDTTLTTVRTIQDKWIKNW